MLPKSKRISRKVFKRIPKPFKFIHSRHFLLKLVLSDKVRVSVSVSKKVSNKAVVRNKIKRRVYTLMQEFLPILPPSLYLFSVKIGAEKLSKAEFKEEISQLLNLREK